jgi:hypothetical protein
MLLVCGLKDQRQFTRSSHSNSLTGSSCTFCSQRPQSPTRVLFTKLLNRQTTLHCTLLVDVLLRVRKIVLVLVVVLVVLDKGLQFDSFHHRVQLRYLIEFGIFAFNHYFTIPATVPISSFKMRSCTLGNKANKFCLHAS